MRVQPILRFQFKPMSQPILSKKVFILFVITLILGMIGVKLLPQLDFIAWLQNTGSSNEVTILQFISDSITFISLGVPLIIALILELKDKNKKGRLLFLFAGLSVGIGGLVSYIIKKSMLVPRPYEIDARIAQLSVGGGFSFPSGHTTEAFAAAMSLLLLFPTWRVALPAFTWAAMVAFSRIYLGVHYPFDIMGGIIIGTTASYLLHFLFRSKTELFS